MKGRAAVSSAWAVVGPPASPRGFFRRAQNGLFGGDVIRFGDKLSAQHNRTRRAWRPNVHRVGLFSAALGARLVLRVTPTALGLAEQAGGLDAYLAGQRVPESDMAAALRERVLLARLCGVRAAGSAGGVPPRLYPTLSALRKDADALLERFVLRADRCIPSAEPFCPG